MQSNISLSHKKMYENENVKLCISIMVFLNSPNTKGTLLALNFSQDCLVITLAPALREKVMAHGDRRCEKDKDSGKQST